MSKTVADERVAETLRAAKAIQEANQHNDFFTCIHKTCCDNEMYNACVDAIEAANLSHAQVIDRAIALASGTAEKPLGEVLAELCGNEFWVSFARTSSNRWIAKRHSLTHPHGISCEADTPDAAVRALEQKVRA